MTRKTLVVIVVAVSFFLVVSFIFGYLYFLGKEKPALEKLGNREIYVTSEIPGLSLTKVDTKGLERLWFDSKGNILKSIDTSLLPVEANQGLLVPDRIQIILSEPKGVQFVDEPTFGQAHLADGYAVTISGNTLQISILGLGLGYSQKQNLEILNSTINMRLERWLTENVG